MKEETRKALLVLLSCLLIVIICFLYLELKTTVTEDPDYCSNKSLIKNAQCLNQFVINNFKYRINEDNNSLTTKELIEEGGDCKDWTEFYKRNLEKNGFENNEEFIMEIKETERGLLGHVFLIAWDEEAYCTFDMKDYNCWEYEL